MSVKEYTLEFNQLSCYALELAGNMQAHMRKFTSGLSDDLVLECKGAMLNRDMDFSRLSVHMQQVEKQKKRTGSGPGVQGAHSQGSVAPHFKPYPHCTNCQKNHLGRCIYGEYVCYNYGKSGHFKNDCPTIRGNMGNARPQANTTVPPPPPKGTTYAIGGSRN
ncbi:uncharacterized protein LOC124886600 [Capsicum annuum]|uniref:uncharacterized protein LOC124886600 n=1 Tax=Capsicum annuum TaxID=4072 RepID=UPI001FB0D6EF|nr:uncharacterized protein LOC124886600 [Capsicum annuum]